ncbi:hypothetical protein MMC07_001422 [Pseudocyphellaria aurata]|nr:hypothetical protein [Pseudocyphellaria aurata]
MSTSTSQKDLMETIILLFMLNQCPESPKANPQQQALSTLSTTYQLPLQRELEIADNLAFLSATKKDPNRVMAVCLEEGRDRRSCTIRLTSNTGDLGKVVFEFRLLARILERAASRVNDKDDDTRALFRCIVALDYFRILSRLRSRHAKKIYGKKSRPVLVTLLDTTVHDQSVQPNSNINFSELEIVRAKTKAVKISFQMFEDIPGHCEASSEVQDVAMSLITSMHDLATRTKLKLALESSSKLDPTLKRSLPEAVMKLGRYYAISYELVCAARNKKYSIFNSVAIESSTIRRRSQMSHVDDNFNPVTALENMLQPKNAVQVEALGLSLEKYLGKPASVILDEFRLTVANYCKFAKVHAEIQLLFFYELSPGRQRPRVICSSKSACYLCDLFFKLHGQFHSPRTHGRLYEKWTLPDWHLLLPEMRRRDFNVLLKQFSDNLEVKIRSALERGPMRVYHPNESVLAMPAYWSSSSITGVKPSVSESVATLRLTSKKDNSPEEELNGVIPSSPISENSVSQSFTKTETLSCETFPELRHPSPRPSCSSPSALALRRQAQEPIYPKALSPPDISIRPPKICSQTPLSLSSTTKLQRYEELIQGEPIWRQLSYPNTSIKIGTNRLHMHLSCDTKFLSNLDITSNPDSSCWVQVKWLQETDKEKVCSPIINVEDLAFDDERRLQHGAACTPTELHLRCGVDLVSIKYRFDGPKREGASERAQSLGSPGEPRDGKDRGRDERDEGEE